MIVRELLTRLGLKVDDKQFQKADKSIGGLVTKMQGLATAVAVVAGARVFGKLIGLASDANETLNVMGEVFGKNAADVKAWARSFGNDTGRSEFRMREMAATLGALLNPQLDGNTEAASAMSSSLAALAVDLGSFFNKTDDEALIALRAGLIGSIEPLLSFGVDLRVAVLEVRALDEGLGKFAGLSRAQKAQLRYREILAQTVNSQGDAKKTADGFANSMKGLKDGFRDLGTRIGLAALPAVEKIVIAIRDGVQSFRDMASQSKILEAGLVVLGAVLAAFAIKGAIALVVAFGPALLLFAKFALAAAVVTIIVDELLTLFAGGTTVIGTFLDEIFGIGTAAAVVQFMTDTVAVMTEAWDDAAGSVIGFFAALLGFSTDIQNIGDVMSNMGATVFEIWEALEDTIIGAIEAIVGKMGSLAQKLGIDIGFTKQDAAKRKQEREFLRSRVLGRGTARQPVLQTGGVARVAQAEERLAARRRERGFKRDARKAIKIGRAEAAKARKAGKTRKADRIEREVQGLERGAGFRQADDLGGGIGRATGRGTVATEIEDTRFGRARVPRAGPSQVIQDNKISISVAQAEGQSEAELVARVRRMIADRDAKNRRAAGDALQQTGG